MEKRGFSPNPTAHFRAFYRDDNPSVSFSKSLVFLRFRRFSVEIPFHFNRFFIGSCFKVTNKGA